MSSSILTVLPLGPGGPLGPGFPCEVIDQSVLLTINFSTCDKELFFLLLKRFTQITLGLSSYCRF